ncbi:NADPH-dependent FMN reductase [Aestuariicoccus sp. MJ-SS9]|uniref:NADPH-dependent FMN reductase n=1 Tax=Aestuariicoccus sp. MJ-SS9 TaxID=3079855 RepID=UPI00290DDFAA|nr:NADPH-dependent FMN reductase [Aestuariicoccus sp. MJ-SS9]MDU8912322.1 NADPH-dependent FMN reductase [Aestuariicoccus sp. MJ-SS9]
MPEILIIPGSLRAASSARATARAIEARFRDRATFVTADVGLLPHYNADVTDDPAVAAFVEQVGAADGVLFVTPEYNYSIPGVLKNAIDWASRPAYASVFKGKPSFVITVSGGVTGGVRAQAHLKYVLNGMLARVHANKEVLVTQANDKVTDGVLTDDAVLGFIDTEFAPFIDSLS